MTIEKKYRLVTRSDFDGLVCGTLLKAKNLVDDILFVHPKDMQDGKVEINGQDITTNLPYVADCYLAFDHHRSELSRLGGVQADNHILNVDAPSAARVVYDYYGGAEVFPTISKEMIDAVDKADMAQFTLDEVLNPTAWPLLHFLMDARTGLGRFRNFQLSNYELMMQLIDYCQTHTIDEILALPDVKERINLYFEHEQAFKNQIKRCSTLHDRLVILDLRKEETIYSGNRFMIYALYPTSTLSIHVLWGREKQNTVFAIGKSILDRSSTVNIGELALQFGGGGHANAGTCQIDNQDVEKVLNTLIKQING